MISKEQFRGQISRVAVLFMRETPRELLREMYEIFKHKEFETFEKAISEVIRNEDRFPSPNVIQNYYQLLLPPKETPETPTRKDLEKAAKTSKHKQYTKLIFGLMDGEIDIEDPRVQQCLNEQGSTRAFSHYDQKRRCFVKTWRG